MGVIVGAGGEFKCINDLTVSAQHQFTTNNTLVWCTVTMFSPSWGSSCCAPSHPPGGVCN